MDKKIKAYELAEILGVALETVRKYTLHGMPCKKQFNGRLLYDFYECIEWMKVRYPKRDMEEVIKKYEMKEGN